MVDNPNVKATTAPKGATKETAIGADAPGVGADSGTEASSATNASARGGYWNSRTSTATNTARQTLEIV
jgi:hypothetical protein